MPSAVDVAFTRADARRADVTVVIDVLRATTTIVQALVGGYERVLCVDSLARALALAAPGRSLAGERRCLRPPGFDFGNSPGEIVPRGAELVLATTNGAPAIVHAAALSRVVLIGSLRNLAAVAEAARVGEEVLVLCAGTDGRSSIEDTYVAGRLVVALGGDKSDSALIAAAAAQAYARPYEALVAGAGARALIEADLGADIEFCARESVVDVVPAVRATEDGIAIVQPRAPEVIS